MLVVGGTGFIGRAFSERMLQRGDMQLTLLNRGISGPDLFHGLDQIRCDRNHPESCRSVLNGRYFDHIVDFSGWSHLQIENIVTHCQFGHYTFISTSAVDLSWPDDQFFQMAQNKLWCEHLIQSMEMPSLIIRPGFVVGQYDTSKRFEFRDARWVWKGTSDAVRPLVHIDLLVGTMINLIQSGHTGTVRAGYTKPRLTFN